MHRPNAGSTAAGPLFLHGVILAAALAPIVATGGLYLFDLPNHLFRMQIVADILSGRPSVFYAFDLRLIPNLPLDLAAALLGRFVDPARIALLVTCAAAASFYLSIVYWRATNRRTTSIWTCLLVVLVLYSFPLQAGLINYILGLGLMNVALARLERRDTMPTAADRSLDFCAGQWALVVVMYFCSIFPVLLYFAWCAGAYLHDLLSRKVSFSALAAHASALHLAPAAVIAAFIFWGDPSPPGDSATVWLLLKKVEGLASIGRMSNLPHEFVMFAAILLALGLRYAAGALRLDMRNGAALAALVVFFLAVPSTLHGVNLVDVRLPMAIVGVLLATGRETAAAARPRINAVATGLVVVLALGRIASLPAAWLPLAGLNAAYADLARRVEPGASVYFVVDGLTNAEREREIVSGWASALAGGDPPTRRTLMAYATFWHLHMAAFRGKDVYLSQTFQNFSIKQKPGLPLELLYRVPLPLAPTVGILARQPYDYVLSHIDLDAVRIPGKKLCLEAEQKTIRLYRLVADDTCPTAIAAGMLRSPPSPP